MGQASGSSYVQGVIYTSLHNKNLLEKTKVCKLPHATQITELVYHYLQTVGDLRGDDGGCRYTC